MGPRTACAADKEAMFTFPLTTEFDQTEPIKTEGTCSLPESAIGFPVLHMWRTWRD
jgi:hypothetical protein